MDLTINQNILKIVIWRYAFCGLDSKNEIYTFLINTFIWVIRVMWLLCAQEKKELCFRREK